MNYKIDRRKDGKKKERSEVPAWLEGDRHRNTVSSSRKTESGVQQLQQHRSRNRNVSTTGRERRSNRSSGQSGESSESRSTSKKRGRETAVDGGTKSGRIREITYHFSMQQLRDSLSDSTLKQLLENDFNPIEQITITKSEQVKFVEDDLIPPLKRKNTRTHKTKKIITPSELYLTEIQQYQRGEIEGSAEVVLGTYFRIYKKLFHEEDPQWSDKSSKSALIAVRTMAVKVADGNYKNLIIYLRKIMPLWKQRLLDNHDFPSSRPTIDALFCGKRYFWANRKVLYKKWQSQKL